MSDEQALQPIETVIPDRRDRYISNLNHLETQDLANIYPPEIKQNRWGRVTDQRAVATFMHGIHDSFKQVDGRFHPALMGIFRSDELNQTYGVPTFGGKYDKPRQVLLDVLAAAKEVAPWASFPGLSISGETAFDVEQGKYSVQAGMVTMDHAVLESLINGLGDPKYTRADKAQFLMESVASIVHESLRIHNRQNLSFGFAGHVLLEAAPTTLQYLVYPGKDKVTGKIADEALSLLRKARGDNDEHTEGLLLGMLALAKDAGFLSQTDAPGDLANGIILWREHIDHLLPDELTKYRNQVFSEILGSEEDKKLREKITELARDYPSSLAHLSIMSSKLE